MWIVGGVRTIQSLVEAGMRPRLELAVIPELRGAGVRLFSAPTWRERLRLVSSRALPSGIVVLEYDPA